MKSAVATAELPSAPNSCDISDIEVCEKNVHAISHVDEEGDGADLKETYYGEIDKGYYHCTCCFDYWPWTMANRLEVWKKVKAHLNA